MKGTLSVWYLSSTKNTAMNKILPSWGFYLLEEDPLINTYIYANRQTDRNTKMNATENHKAGKGIGSAGGRGCSYKLGWLGKASLKSAFE